MRNDDFGRIRLGVRKVRYTLQLNNFMGIRYSVGFDRMLEKSGVRLDRVHCRLKSKIIGDKIIQNFQTPIESTHDK